MKTTLEEVKQAYGLIPGNEEPTSMELGAIDFCYEYLTKNNTNTDLSALVKRLRKYRSEGATIIWDNIIDELERIANA